MLADPLAKAVADLREEQVFKLVQERLAEGSGPLTIMADIKTGMEEVGRRFCQGEYFYNELLLFSKKIAEVLALFKPYLDSYGDKKKGVVITGTVKGDFHDLGKNFISLLFCCAGYEVIDLGVNVAKEEFAAAVQKTKAPLIAISIHLTHCLETLKEVVTAIRQTGVDTQIVIGGYPLEENDMYYVGADFFAESADDALQLAASIFADKTKKTKPCGLIFINYGL
ncbi:MAG: 5-methyltetrahydrofolate--homocysteine methyltransferase [Firmicutes bacterium]|nr:5-methyltetrahydrofolate--homocysteine methyltransferase [Bacillota bacterium]